MARVYDHVAIALIIFGILSTCVLGATQLRRFRLMVKLSFSGSKSAFGISSFQSLMLSLAGRVGSGNIAGVAGAILMGGPGAIFWMWFIAFFGCATSFVESTLGQLYKVRYGSQYRAGLALYTAKTVKRITKCDKMAMYSNIVISVVCMFVFSFFVMLPHSDTMVGQFSSIGVPEYITLGIISTLFLLVAVGGIKRIVSIIDYLAPIIGLVYVLSGILVLLLNIKAVPGAFEAIFMGAWSPRAGLGGVFGAALLFGAKRGIYSNEAGMGSIGPHVGGVAEVNHPAEQVFVQAFAIYIDTFVVCTVTALTMIIANSYNVYVGDNAIYTGAAELSADSWVAFPVEAFNRAVFRGFGSFMIPVVLPIFAFTTILNNYYLGESNAAMLDSLRPQPKIFGQSWLIRLTQALTVFALVVGALYPSGVIWRLADVGVCVLVAMNVVVMLSNLTVVCRVHKDYIKQIKQVGKDITFNPEELGIHDASFWKTRG